MPNAETHLPPNWQHRLLTVIGAQDTPENRRLLDAWAVAEGGTARWNPLNTTYPLPGATDYNSVHVRNYHRPTEGVCATACTLVNGVYNGILGDLQAGTFTALQIVERHGHEFDTWGTGAAHIRRVLQQT